MAKKIKSTIVWAIDPNETKYTHRAPLAKFLKKLSSGLSQKVFPYSLVSPGGSTWPIPVDYAFGLDMKAKGEQSVKKELKKLHMKGLAPPTVEVHASASRRELVDSLIRYAKVQHASMIAVNTKRYLSKASSRMGGFAEALVQKSNVPVLAVSPNAKINGKLNEILFPTDYTIKSRKAFRKTLLLAKSLNAKVHILFVDNGLQAPFPDFGLDLPASWSIAADMERRSLSERQAPKWIAEGKKLGVRCEAHTEVTQDSVANAIARFSQKKHCDLISLASYRGEKTPSMIGGTVRDVLRAAKTPVLELRAG